MLRSTCQASKRRLRWPNQSSFFLYAVVFSITGALLLREMRMENISSLESGSHCTRATIAPRNEMMVTHAPAPSSASTNSAAIKGLIITRPVDRPTSEPLALYTCCLGTSNRINSTSTQGANPAGWMRYMSTASLPMSCARTARASSVALATGSSSVRTCEREALSSQGGRIRASSRPPESASGRTKKGQ